MRSQKFNRDSSEKNQGAVNMRMTYTWSRRTVDLRLIDAALQALIGQQPANPRPRLSLEAPQAPPLQPPQYRGQISRRLVRRIEPQLIET